MNGTTLDSGALIAFERGDRRLVVLFENANLFNFKIAVPAGVLAQVWRDGRKQARLARALQSPVVEIVPLDGERAKAAGQLCGASGTADVIDAAVVLCARARNHSVMTSDPDGLARLDPTLSLIRI